MKRWLLCAALAFVAVSFCACSNVSYSVVYHTKCADYPEGGTEAVILTSVQEFQEHLAAHKYPGEEAPDGNFDAEFFQSNNVVAVIGVTGSGNDDVSVYEVNVGAGRIRVTLKVTSPDGPGTCDMASHLFYVTVPKVDCQGVTQATVD